MGCSTSSYSGSRVRTTSIPDPPSCYPVEMLSVVFQPYGKVYAIDERSAKNLAVNINNLRGCLEEYSLFERKIRNGKIK